MIKPQNWRIIAGIALLLVGGLLLLQNFGILPNSGWFWAVPFVAGGAAFISVLFSGKQNWWAVIPGVILLDLGVIIALDAFMPEIAGNFTGGIFLAGIALAFLLVYLMQNNNWWALIPMGVLATLSIITLLEDTGIFDTGVIFFLGLALTFALVALLPNGSRRRMNWPWYPAGALLAVGALSSIGAENMSGLVWAGALILVGLFMLLRAFRKE